MGYPTKIATCCHCGTKAALRLNKTRHSLSCASCGAPLSALKMVPVPQPRKEPTSHQPRVRQFTKKPKPAPPKKKKYKKSKRRAEWLKDLVEDAFDFVEDIFD